MKKQNFYTLPQALYELEGIKTLLSHENNCILHKKIDHDIVNAEKLIVAHSIVYVVNGRVSVSTFDGEEIEVKNGEMLFMPRDSYLISDYLCKGQNMEVFLLFFDHEIVMKFIDSFQDKLSQKSTICQLEANKNIRNFFENLSLMELNNSHNKTLLELKLLEFLHLINDTQNFMQTLQASEKGKQKRAIESLMLEHYDKNMSIADFASLSGRSLSTFNREFKQIHGITPKQWLIEKRMHQAFELLQSGKTVTQTAFDMGYLNVSNFIKAYKRVYGETPKVMQKSLL